MWTTWLIMMFCGIEGPVVIDRHRRAWIKRIAGLFLLGLLAGGLGCSVTSEKRIQKPIQVAYSVADPQFRNALTHLLGPALVDGNSVVELLNGDQIFPAMLDAIRNAQQTITIEQYIWSPGQVSDEFVEALLDRARAGVKVHIIVDGIGS